MAFRMERRGTGADTLPPPPEFEEAIERVRERIAKTVGKLTVPREMRIWHPVVDKLLKEDEQRRERQRASSYVSSWDAPRFDTPFERRRLRVLNTLVLAAGTMNGKPSMNPAWLVLRGVGMFAHFVHSGF